MKLRYIFNDAFKFWIADLLEGAYDIWNSSLIAHHMQERTDWYDEVEWNTSDLNRPLYTFLDLGENAEPIEGCVKRGAFTYTIYKLNLGWQLLNAEKSLNDLFIKDGDCLLIDSSFKPSRGVIATPRPLMLPKNFTAFAQAHEFSSFRAPYVKICYTAECGSIGLDFRNHPHLLQKIANAGFSVSVDETKDRTNFGKHPYAHQGDHYRQLLFDALGWYNYTPKKVSHFIDQLPHLSWLFNQGYLGFIKVAYSPIRNYDPEKYLYIAIDGDYSNTLQKLLSCIDNIESYRQQHFEELREIILECIPHMKLEKTSSYHVMLEQIMRQKTLGLMSEDEARRISHREAHQQMTKVNLTDLFYEQCTKEFGERARIYLG